MHGPIDANYWMVPNVGVCVKLHEGACPQWAILAHASHSQWVLSLRACYAFAVTVYTPTAEHPTMREICLLRNCNKRKRNPTLYVLILY